MTTTKSLLMRKMKTKFIERIFTSVPMMMLGTPKDRDYEFVS